MKKQALNPYLPSYEYVPDGEPYVFGDRVYVYGSHDKFNGTQYCGNPNQYIANMNDGSVAGFKYFIFDKVEEISVKVRGNGNGVFFVSTELGGKPVSEIPVTAEVDLSVFTAPINIDKGVKPLYFTYKGEGSFDFISFTIK